MATFVLIHGAWHGGWCWKRVTPYLRADGHDVVAPTLTGLGERSHLVAPEVCLSTHVQDIANLLFYEDLRDVILVGHSYGGMILSGVAEVIPESIARLVYLDAIIPDDGQSVFDVFPRFRDEWNENSIEVNGASVYPFPRAYLDGWEITDPVDVAWIEARLTPHPVATEDEPLQLPQQRAATIPSTYIRCSGSADAPIPMSRHAKKAVDMGMDLHELPTAHVAMVTAPRDLAVLLGRIAGDPVNGRNVLVSRSC